MNPQDSIRSYKIKGSDLGPTRILHFPLRDLLSVEDCGQDQAPLVRVGNWTYSVTSPDLNVLLNDLSAALIIRNLQED